MRSEAREAAFKVVFAGLFHGADNRKLIESVIKKAELKEEDACLTRELVSLVKEHEEELRTLLSAHVEKLADYRIYAADRAIMYVMIAEVKYLSLPAAVAVSEAAALARKYSTESSVGFIGGMLGSIIDGFTGE